jgi:hypothetical protein
MMASSGIFIPQDVINSVIDELKDDRRSLSTCSLAARSFLEPCQRYLFFQLDLDNSPKDGNRQLQDVLTDNPRIQSYIRHLRLRLISLYGTVRHEGVLPEILQMLPQLRSFTLSHGITTGLLHFGSISHALKSSIFNLLQCDHLSRVKLGHLQEFPIYFLSRCPQLQELRLSDVNPFHIDMWFEPNPELVPSHAEALPKNDLKSLTLDMECNPSWSFVHAQTFNHIRSTVNLSHLTRITIGHLSVNEEIEECRKILESSKFLEELTVTLDLSLGMEIQSSVILL